MIDEIGVHRTHCCALHGCKYGEDDNCPVFTKEVEQDYLCEECGIGGIHDMNTLNDMSGHVNQCPHCGGIL